jgi:hypothetical protein
MFGRSIRKSVMPHLHAGETLVTAVFAQSRGTTRSLMAHALGPTGAAVRADAANLRAEARAAGAAEAAGLATAAKMVLAITTRRLLVLTAGGLMTVRAKALIGAVPIDEVDAIAVERVALVKIVTVTARGACIEPETPRAQPAETLTTALERVSPTPSASAP